MTQIDQDALRAANDAYEQACDYPFNRSALEAAIRSYLTAAKPQIRGDEAAKWALINRLLDITRHTGNSIVAAKIWQAISPYLHPLSDTGLSQLQAELDAVRGENQQLRKVLGQISRMKTMPDQKANTFTLAIAHKLAEEALALPVQPTVMDQVVEENRRASESDF
jgi:hypothetical protein